MKINKGKIILYGISGIVFILILFGMGMLYRVNYAEMKAAGWENNCRLMLYKTTDSDTQIGQLKQMLIDIEGYGEDKIVYNEGRNINNRCYELFSNRNKFISRYVIFGVGIDGNEDGNEGSPILETCLVVFIMMLVIFGLVIGFAKLNEDEDDDEDEHPYF